MHRTQQSCLTSTINPGPRFTSRPSPAYSTPPGWCYGHYRCQRACTALETSILRQYYVNNMSILCQYYVNTTSILRQYYNTTILQSSVDVNTTILQYCNTRDYRQEQCKGSLIPVGTKGMSLAILPSLCTYNYWPVQINI